MLTLVDTLGPLFGLILVGLALGRLDIPGGDFWPQAERLIYNLLFPALLVHALATTHFADVPVAGLIAATLGPTMIVAGALWLARRRIGRDHAAFTSVFQGAIRFNTYVAIAGATSLHGAAGTAASAVVIAVLVPAVNVASVLSLLAGSAPGPVQMLRSLAGNPLIVACALGIALNLTGIGLPGWSAPMLAMIGGAALPLALLAVGAALRPDTLLQTGRAFWVSSVVKLVVLPGVALAIALAFGLTGTARDVVLLFCANATATSAYVLARQLGGDADLMARLITGQTLLAMLTLPAWLALAG